jgi:xylan 1,4-beta-xylosidase
MKLFFTFIAAIVISAQVLSQIPGDTIELADPTIFPHDNKFYLYGTVEKKTGNGFLVYVSDDLKSWKLSDKNNGYALKKGDAFGRSGFWAPQVFTNNNKFYMAYTANEQIAIAEGTSPLGPFIQQQKDSLTSTIKQIDPFIFIDDDEKKYLYHVRLTNGNRIFVAEMHDDFSGIKTETVKECITSVEPWENTKQVSWPVAEGPTVIKHQGTYYLFYSANDFRNPDYTVGYATSNHPLGPWKKHPKNPILTRQMPGINGTGHGDVFRRNNEWYYVLHTHNSNTRAQPRKSALVKMQIVKNKPDVFTIAPGSFLFLILNSNPRHSE